MDEMHNPSYKHATTHYVTNLNIMKFDLITIHLQQNLNNNYFDIFIYTTFKPL